MSETPGEDAADNSILHLFRRELETHTQTLERGATALQKNEGVAEAIDKVLEAARNIRGSAKLMQLSPLSDLGTALQKLMQPVKSGDASTIQASVPKLEKVSKLLTELLQMDDVHLCKVEEWDSQQLKSLEEATASLESHSAADEAETSTQQAAASGQTVAVETLPPNGDDTSVPTDATTQEASGQLMADEQIIGLFFVDLESQTGSLNEGLLSLEGDAHNSEALESLMRAAHSIKGAARVLGLYEVINLAHALEDAFSRIQQDATKFDGNLTDALFAAVDLLGSLSKSGSVNVGMWVASQRETMERLAAQLSSDAPQPSPPQHKDAPPTPTPAPAGAADPVFVVTPSPSAPPKPSPSQGVKATSAPVAVANDAEDAAPKTSAKRLEQAQTAGSSNTRDRVVRVSADYLTQLMGLAGELLVESRWLHPFSDALMQLKKTQYELSGLVDELRGFLSEKILGEEGERYLMEMQQNTQLCRENLTNHLDQLESFIRRHATLSDRLYREVIASRMCPFGDGVEAFPRMVRDVARQLRKKVSFEIIGRSTSIDRDILDKLKAPLNHLLRNAIDHGIESPEEREAAGKEPVGHVRLEARHRAGVLCITVADDGRGIDLNEIRQRVTERKLIDVGMVEHLTEAELLDFLFLPGFSTSKDVTEISGRGVGLNVVQNMVHEVSGQIRVTGKKGEGIVFHLQLPLTLSVLRALLVEIGGEAYAFPLARIERSMVIDREQVQVVENRQYYNFEGQNIGLIPGYRVLELEQAHQHGHDLSVVILSDGFNAYGVVVDQLLGERELVVQELDPRLGKVSDIACGAFMEDGSPILIIDVEDMVRSVDKLLSSGGLGQLTESQDDDSGEHRKRILVVDDSITVREVECRILENQGYAVDVAVNGVDGWNTVRIGDYDLVITDVDMPRMNGIELVRHIKGDARLRNMPVMIVSYKERSQDRMLGLEAGANYYLAKSSFHDDRFLEAVRDLIGEAMAT